MNVRIGLRKCDIADTQIGIEARLILTSVGRRVFNTTGPRYDSDNIRRRLT